MKRALPNDKPLGEPKLRFEDTFSAETIVLERLLRDDGLTNFRFTKFPASKANVSEIVAELSAIAASDFEIVASVDSETI